jgi:MFS transporter, DHA1 family, multidrug resistance protein
MVVIMVSVGMVIPACQLAVLQPYGAIAGTASGLFFFTQMFLTALSSWATGLLSDGTPTPLVIMTVAASTLLVTGWLMLRKTKCGSGLARDGGVPVN